MKLFAPARRRAEKRGAAARKKTAVWGLRRAQEWGMMGAKPARGRRALRGKAGRGGMCEAEVRKWM